MPAQPQALPPCDLVMKGGITSGVVYPKMLAKLAQTWRFKNVGGTSAGAIAAAGCAAAEHGRQTGRNAQAFATLAQLPDALGQPVKPGSDNSVLFHLFKPAPWLTDHFQVLVGALNRQSTTGIVFGALGVLLRRFWIVAALTVLVMALLGVPALMTLLGRNGPDAAWMLVHALLAAGAVWGVFAVMPGGARVRVLLALITTAGAVGWLLRVQAGLTGGATLTVTTLTIVLWLVLTALVATLIAAVRFVLSLLAGLHRNGWGLVSGHSTDEAAQPQALTDWLVNYFDTLAGRSLQGRPLTFGDLWGRPDGPPLAEEPEDGAPREIDLQVMTTAVSQQLCYALPFRPGINPFFYCREEWAALFPRRVMAWFDQVSAVLDQPAHPVFDAKGRSLRRLPHNADLPVVVAVRMSLSFPVLLSAVPLYAVDRSLQQGNTTPPATRVWFSDGGIGSNMPLHFFDAPLPGRPTFAVNLKDEHPRYKIDPLKRAREQVGRVYLPKNNNQGLQPQHWKAPDDNRLTGLFSFLMQIVNTMQNWRDQIQFPSPGYRDRIVQVSQIDGEGGLNLNMPRKHIERLADAGEHAAEQLDERFRVNDGWPNHRSVRLRSFVALAEELVRSRGLHQGSWDEVAQSLERYSEAERLMVLEVLERLRAIGREFGQRQVSLLKEAPRPLPQMRVTPRI